MASVRVMLATPSAAFFARAHGLLHARPEVRFLPERVDMYRPLVAIRREQPDVLLIDAEESGEAAVNVVRRVSALDLPTRTLVLHTNVRELRIAHVLRCGGAGCLARTCIAPELIRAILAVHRGELWASRRVLADVLQLMRITVPVGPLNEPAAGLSRREREIVGWMRQGMTNKQIGRVLGISDMTVKTHAHNIFHKLEVSGRRVLGVVAALDH